MTNTKVLTSEKDTHPVYVYPVIFTMCIIPLIIRFQEFYTGFEKYNWYANSNGMSTDFFLYYKSILLIIISAVILIMLLVCIKNYKIKWELAFVPLAGYAFLVLLSSLATQYPEYTYKGIVNQFEPVWVILGYCVMAFYCYNIANLNNYYLLLKAWSIFALYEIILGISQAFGFDLISSNFGKRLITPTSFWDNLDQLKFVFGKNRVYLTLYNPNYVGLFASLAIPIFLAMLLFHKSKKQLVTYTIIIVGLLICVIGSQSKNALIALIITVTLELILFRKIIRKHLKIVLAVIIPLIILCVGIDGINNFAYTKAVVRTLTTKDVEHSISNIDTNKENIIINYKNNDLKVTYSIDDNDYFIFGFYDSKDALLEAEYNTHAGLVSIADTRYNGLLFEPTKINDVISFYVQADNQKFAFTNATDGSGYKFYNYAGKWCDIQPATSAKIFSESLFSGRGYIWNRTIPLLKDKIFIGSGADTFTMEYPQESYIDASNNGYYGSIVSKPHNFYLQMGVQSGVLSLILFLCFYLIYAVKSLHLFTRNNFTDPCCQIGVAIFVGTVGYMISSIVNDSTITVSPMFWCLLGFGMGINAIIKKSIAVIKVKHR